MTGSEFLEVARHLKASNTEAAWRSAISRAYYAAFHEAKAFLERLGFRAPKADRAHHYLIYRFSNAQIVDAQRIGSDLDTLRTSRNKADYDFTYQVDSIVANRFVEIADCALANIEALKTGKDLDRIRDAIRIYERDILNEVTWRP